MLCHPDKAILCLEVKGGGLECKHGEWYRLVDGKRERMKDPFTQALDHRYALGRQLDGRDGIRAKALFLVQGLAFPDISVHKLVLAPDAPAEIVIDRNGVTASTSRSTASSPTTAVPARSASRPEQAGADALRDLLALDVVIEVPMANEFLDEEEELIRLTHQQAMLLNRFGRDRRMVITGCAGSGKTMLAVEQAKRHASRGEDVLFVCFNRALREHLRQREGKSGVRVLELSRALPASGEPRRRRCSRRTDLPAFSEAPHAVSGTLNGKPFTRSRMPIRASARASSCSRRGSTRSFRSRTSSPLMQPPKRLRDLLWAPVIVRTAPSFKGVELGEVMMPVMAPGSWQDEDDSIRLGARPRGLLSEMDVRPIGQRVLRAMTRKCRCSRCVTSC